MNEDTDEAKPVPEVVDTNGHDEHGTEGEQIELNDETAQKIQTISSELLQREIIGIDSNTLLGVIKGVAGVLENQQENVYNSELDVTQVDLCDKHQRNFDNARKI